MKRKPLVEDIQNFAQNIVDTVREPLLILDAALPVRSANRAFYQTFQVSPVETEDHLIYELGNGQWDIPALRTLLEDIVPQSSVFNDFELEHDFPAIGRKVMLLNARSCVQAIIPSFWCWQWKMCPSDGAPNDCSLKSKITPRTL